MAAVRPTGASSFSVGRPLPRCDQSEIVPRKPISSAFGDRWPAPPKVNNSASVTATEIARVIPSGQNERSRTAQRGRKALDPATRFGLTNFAMVRKTPIRVRECGPLG